MGNHTDQFEHVRRTWWVKIRRAEKHLRDIRAELERFREVRRHYDVETNVKTSGGAQFLCVRGHLPLGDRALEEELEDFAALVGDFGNNVRAALDHICVALGEEENQFPIFTADPWVPRINPKTNKDENEKSRKRFMYNTTGVPEHALALIKSVQPYMTNAVNVEFDPLALLAHLSNSDKHRRLVFTAKYLCNVQCTVTYPGYESQVTTSAIKGLWHGADGAIISDMFTVIPNLEPEVEALGGLEIGLKEVDRGRTTNADWVLPGTLEGILIRVKDDILTPLDKFAL